MRVAKEAAKQQQDTDLKAALTLRGYRLVNNIEADVQHPLAPTARVSLTADGLVFPVMLLYPEHNQSDFISEFNENDTFYERLGEIFAAAAPWDTSNSYTLQNLDWYFESSDMGLVSILRHVTAKNVSKQTAAHRFVHLTLADVLSHPLFKVTNQVCAITVLVRGSEFSTKYRETYKNL